MAAPQTELTEAARRAVRFLAEQVPLQAWLVALTDDTGGWTPLAVVDRGYGFVEGERLTWQDTVCSRMVQGLGPHVAARVVDVVDYAAAPIQRTVPVGAYIGAALLAPDGALVGTLCGVDPLPQPARLDQHLPVVLVLAELLGSLHRAVSDQAAATERAEDAEAAALLRPAHRGAEPARLDRPAAADHGAVRPVRRPAGPALAGPRRPQAGQRHLRAPRGRRAAAGRRERPRPGAAPLGPAGAHRRRRVRRRRRGHRRARPARLLGRVTAALAAAGVRVSAGGVLRAPFQPVEQAWALADARMYEVKQRRRALVSRQAQAEGTRST